MFAQRARVGQARRLQVAVPGLLAALWARRGHRATVTVTDTANAAERVGVAEVRGMG